MSNFAFQKKIAPIRNEFQGMRDKDDVVVDEIDIQFKKMFKLQVYNVYCEILSHDIFKTVLCLAT